MDRFAAAARFALSAGALGLAGCATPPGAPDRESAAMPQRHSTPPEALGEFEGLTPEIAGIWRSNGYGYLADLRADAPVFYHLTDEICLPFTGEESSLFESVDRLGVATDRSRLIVGASPEPHTYEFTKIAELPAQCRNAPRDNAEAVFDAFVSYMAQHYGFFDVYGVDWAQRTAAARERLAQIATEADLFDLLAGMLDGLNDGHLSLAAEIDGVRREFDPGEAQTYRNAARAGEAKGQTAREARRAFDRAVWFGGVSSLLLEGTGVSTGNDWIKYGLVAPDVGYFATFTSGGFASRDFSDPLGDLAILETALEDALARFEQAKVRAVIIDASMNHGGHDFISRAMASRFAAQETPAYVKYAADADDPYRTDVAIVPSEGRRFTGPVWLLTSDITVSAAEILTLSMRALPNVVHAGGTTRGAFSDILEKTLPNGWVLTLSNEVYLDHDGLGWEGRGLPPALPSPVFAADDPAASHAAAIAMLIARARASGD